MDDLRAAGRKLSAKMQATGIPLPDSSQQAKPATPFRDGVLDPQSDAAMQSDYEAEVEDDAEEEDEDDESAESNENTPSKPESAAKNRKARELNSRQASLSYDEATKKAKRSRAARY